MSREQYRTVREVADLLQVNEVTVRRWIKDGELRAIDIGKGWRIGPEDLDAFLDDHATRPTATGHGGTNTAPEMTGADKTKGPKN
ncbi:DNA-binding protein [Rhodovulum sp. 12E13]|uniref:helix-turn-helix domain-containing protein n=1 Tax=Rhodovulum sp. 12E13 TaxID=2203891 RepID=UPI000E15975D|nr:helix-turn-helix domain-containing protein [Rhodovulum sp. 12E13]RDC71775.1 DNA-binding protein [Rhodovulum sp. 12E13]